MCERLGELRKALGDVAAGFDAALLTVSDAAQAVRDASAIEKMGATLKALAAARVADTEYWTTRGNRSPAHALAKESGTSVTQAADAIETGRRLMSNSKTSEAARAGKLSPAQASAIAKATKADPAAEQRLLDTADDSSLQELRDECGRIQAAASDLEERNRRIHAERSLRAYTGADGVGNLRVRDTPDVIAKLMGVIEPERDRLFEKARKEGRREPAEAYGVDALVHLLCGDNGDGAQKASSRSRPKIIVRVDIDALLRGYPLLGEVCEICGFGPVPVSAVLDMVETQDPFLAAVATKGAQVAGVAHLSRRPNAHQQTALEWIHPTCAVKGCSALARLQNDHRIDWVKTRFTLFDLLDRLCAYHHRLKTVEGWALVEGRGKREFMPPEDPRHPNYAHAPPSAG